MMSEHHKPREGGLQIDDKDDSRTYQPRQQKH